MKPPTNPYAKERKDQVFYYPAGWKAPILSKLKERTAKVYRGMDLTRVDGLAASCEQVSGVDGTGIVPKIACLGRLFGIDDPYGFGYGRIVERVLDLIGERRPLYNYSEGRLSGRYIRLDEDVKALLRQREEETPGDVLVLPISLGGLYAGFSPRNARWEAMHRNQLPLGSAQVGSLLLTMPERLASYNDLFIDCPADECDGGGYDQWTHCPYFGLFGSEVGFCASGAACKSIVNGSAVAFLGARD